jgi:trk system potassium uptake protein TrkH
MTGDQAAPLPEPREPTGDRREGAGGGAPAARQASRARRPPAWIQLDRARRPASPGRPAVVFVLSWALLIAVGTLALASPPASADGRWTPLSDALFTATSAVSLTGLVVLDTGSYWSGFGQAVILLLFQVGGFGFMTTSTLLLILAGRQIGLRDRVLLRETLGTGSLGSALSLSQRIGLFMLASEAVGAALLSLRFATEMDVPRALWWGLFHSASAFNNAGFDLLGSQDSLLRYQADPSVLLPVAILMLLGATSYPVVEELATRRRFVRLSLDSKLVLVTGGGLLVAGTAALLVTEHANTSTLGGLALGPRLLNALFLTAARTGGYSAVDVGALSDDGLLVLMGLMFVGGSSGSTAGGIKLQTFSILFFVIVSAVRGVTDVQAFGRRVPVSEVMRAVSVALLSVGVVFALFFALGMTESVPFQRLLFEAISALATVGLSTGVTDDLSAAGQLMLVVAMFVGRLGPLTLALALAARVRPIRYRWPWESVRIG